MRRKGWMGFLLVFLVLLLMFIVTLFQPFRFGYTWSSKHTTSGEEEVLQSPIKTITPIRRDFRKTLSWAGRVFCQTVVHVKSLESGKIATIAAADDSYVQKGSLLFTLGGTVISSKMIRLNIQLASLEKRYSLARTNVIRRRKATTQKLISFDKLSMAENQLAAIESEIKSKKQELIFLKKKLEVRSPIHGVFTHRQISVGQQIEKNTVLADIIDPYHLKVKGTVFPTADIPIVGLTATIYSTDGKEVTGVIKRVQPERTPAGGLVFWIEGEQINRCLKPGEGICGKLTLKTDKNALAVPKKSIVRDEDDKPYVFVKRNQTYEKRPVELGLSDNKWVEILSGITHSDEVVSCGAYELFYKNFNKIFKVPD